MVDSHRISKTIFIMKIYFDLLVVPVGITKVILFILINFKHFRFQKQYEPGQQPDKSKFPCF